jgi:hypothetical protein
MNRVTGWGESLRASLSMNRSASSPRPSPPSAGERVSAGRERGDRFMAPLNVHDPEVFALHELASSERGQPCPREPKGSPLVGLCGPHSELLQDHGPDAIRESETRFVGAVPESR